MPNRRPTILLVQNSTTSGPGRLPGWLEEAGVDARVMPGAELPEHLAGGPSAVDGLVLLGGGFMPDDDEHAPWLPRERRLVGEAMGAGVPVLGICLGAQVLAHVAGGEVTASSGETEKGSCPVDLLGAAADDPLFGGLGTVADGGRLRMIENHRDSITALPPGSVHLATSDACRVQAFRVGASAWGVQFHPEVAAARLAVWDEAELARGGFDRAALLAQAEADAPVNEAQARALVHAFARVVRAAAGSAVA